MPETAKRVAQPKEAEAKTHAPGQVGTHRGGVSGRAFTYHRVKAGPLPSGQDRAFPIGPRPGFDALTYGQRSLQERQRRRGLGWEEPASERASGACVSQAAEGRDGVDAPAKRESRFARLRCALARRSLIVEARSRPLPRRSRPPAVAGARVRSTAASARPRRPNAAETSAVAGPPSHCASPFLRQLRTGSAARLPANARGRAAGGSACAQLLRRKLRPG